MTLGEKIKIARLRKKMSQKDLGELADVHQKNISKYEQNLVIPSAVALKKIADVLEVTTDYLLGDERGIIQDVALLNQFQVVDTMPENDKSALMRVIDAYIRDFRTRKAYS
jgi:transcriptional regulator with XRE-family HTH domain